MLEGDPPPLLAVGAGVVLAEADEVLAAEVVILELPEFETEADPEAD